METKLTQAQSKIKSSLYTLIGLLGVCGAVSLITITGFTALVYRLDCQAGQDSSIFELRDQFKLELVCPAEKPDRLT